MWKPADHKKQKKGVKDQKGPHRGIPIGGPGGVSGGSFRPKKEWFTNGRSFWDVEVSEEGSGKKGERTIEKTGRGFRELNTGNKN